MTVSDSEEQQIPAGGEQRIEGASHVRIGDDGVQIEGTGDIVLSDDPQTEAPMVHEEG